MLLYPSNMFLLSSSFLFYFFLSQLCGVFCFVLFFIVCCKNSYLNITAETQLEDPHWKYPGFFLAQRESLELNLLALRSKTGIFTLKNQAFWLPQNLKSGNVELQSPMTTLVWIGVIVPLRQNMCLFIHIICQAFWVFGYVIHGTYSAFILSAFLLLA